jgi:hypothetical protein
MKKDSRQPTFAFNAFADWDDIGNAMDATCRVSTAARVLSATTAAIAADLVPQIA